MDLLNTGIWYTLLVTWAALAYIGLKGPFSKGLPLGRWIWLIPASICGTLLAITIKNPAGLVEKVILLDWIPQEGIQIAAQVDGLSLFFGIVVSGMGTLIFLYTAGYFAEKPKEMKRFYGYLLFFMAAMLGTVFSANLLTMYLWWEMTGIASFFLIGYLHEDGEARKGARMALLTTISTGLCMLAGILLIGIDAGTFEFSQLAELAKENTDNPIWIAGFILIALGAFGKSAQFPFHYWLPNAMSAPTPVSAYLHSATMVKLGVFLIARIFPIFSSLEIWVPLLILVGFFTFGLGALLAFLSDKLKAILAFSTVSQLGFLIGFYGMSAPQGAHWDLLHITNHVFYKGALFMIVGIIDHSTHIKNIRELGGLRKRMPLMFLAALVSAASMAGVIFTSGFLSKEYMLKEKLDYLYDGIFLNAYPIILVILASILKVAFSIRFVQHIFFGKEPEAVTKGFHKPSLLIQFPPLFLTGLTLLTGIFPGIMSLILNPFHIGGLHATTMPKLKLWHGLSSPAFLLSMGILIAGVIVYIIAEKLKWKFTGIPRILSFDKGFNALIDGLPAFGSRVSKILLVDSPHNHVAAVLFVGLLWMLFAMNGIVSMDLLPEFKVDEWIQPTLAAFLIASAGICILVMRSWRGQVMMIGTVGFLMTFYFVIYRAPDLALTQVLIEAASLVLILVLIIRFPQLQQKAVNTPTISRFLKAGISVCIGLLMFFLTLILAGTKNSDYLGSEYARESLPMAKGTNAVNTVLVDFRGFDTLLEIGVLTIATMGILGLFTFRKRKGANDA